MAVAPIVNLKLIRSQIQESIDHGNNSDTEVIEMVRYLVDGVSGVKITTRDGIVKQVSFSAIGVDGGNYNYSFTINAA
jgi:hypothetical protein